MKVKLALSRHLPLLVYGAKDPVYHGDMAAEKSMQEEGAKIKGLVSSGEAMRVMDNKQMDVHWEGSCDSTKWLQRTKQQSWQRMKS